MLAMIRSDRSCALAIAAGSATEDHLMISLWLS